MEIRLGWGLNRLAVFESVFLTEFGNESLLRDGSGREVAVPVDGHLEDVVEDPELLDFEPCAERLDESGVPLIAVGGDDVVI